MIKIGQHEPGKVQFLSEFTVFIVCVKVVLSMSMVHEASYWCNGSNKIIYSLKNVKNSVDK